MGMLEASKWVWNSWGKFKQFWYPSKLLLNSLILLLFINLFDYFNEKSITITTFEGNIVIIKIGDFEARPIKWNDFKG
jgi:hypothetical protein